MNQLFKVSMEETHVHIYVQLYNTSKKLKSGYEITHLE